MEMKDVGMHNESMTIKTKQIQFGKHTLEIKQEDRQEHWYVVGAHHCLPLRVWMQHVQQILKLMWHV